jgi:hypothetical protein
MKSHQNLAFPRGGSVNPKNMQGPVSDASLCAGDKVVVLDVFGKPTGISCTVKEVERHSVAVTWKGGDGIVVGRAWLRKVS